MARAGRPPADDPARRGGRIRVEIRIDPIVRHALRLAAARRGCSMADIASEAVAAHPDVARAVDPEGDARGDEDGGNSG